MKSGKYKMFNFSRCQRLCMLALVFSLTGILVSGTVLMAEENAGGSADALMYMVDVDALELFGTVKSVRTWNREDGALLNPAYFAPQVVTVDVEIHDGHCAGSREFYLKKDVLDQDLVPGEAVMFQMNKNECKPESVLIMMQAEVMKTEGGKK